MFLRSDRRSMWIVIAVAVSLMGASVAQDSTGRSEIDVALDGSISVVFEDAHVKDVLTFISDTYAVNIIVDDRVVRPDDPSRAHPDAEYVTDGVIAYINLKNVSVREALRAIVYPLNLTYSVQRNFIWISTPEKIQHETFENLETRFYVLQNSEVHNLNAALEIPGQAPIDIVNLLSQVVPEILEPVTNKRLSFMRLNEKSKQLVVHTTPSNHRTIEQMLSLVN